MNLKPTHGFNVLDIKHDPCESKQKVKASEVDAIFTKNCYIDGLVKLI